MTRRKSACVARAHMLHAVALHDVILGDHMRHVITVFGAIGISAALMASPVRAWEVDQLPPSYMLGMNAVTGHTGFSDADGGVLGDRANGSILGVDTIPTFDSFFYDPGFTTTGSPQFTW